LVIVRPSSSSTSSHWRLSVSSMRSVVVMYVSLKSNECQWQVLYSDRPSISRWGNSQNLISTRLQTRSFSDLTATNERNDR
jgi:hypothetical protein